MDDSNPEVIHLAEKRLIRFPMGLFHPTCLEVVGLGL
jgi:hypothetical protein